MIRKLQTKYEPGTQVEGGLYWNRKTWEFVDIPADGGILPAGKGIYHRIPVLLAMGMAPIIGLGFILFLPIAVPAVLIYIVGKRLMRRLGGPVVPVSTTE